MRGSSIALVDLACLVAEDPSPGDLDAELVIEEDLLLERDLDERALVLGTGTLKELSFCDSDVRLAGDLRSSSTLRL